MVKLTCFVRRTFRASAFSIVEIVLICALLGLITSFCVTAYSRISTTTKTTKLTTDVQKLNMIIATYLAEGGSLDGLTSPQDILDKVKTKRTLADVRTNVGAMTGRGVDIRLASRMQTSAEASSSAPRAIWNSTIKRFQIATTGSGGVANFVLDDSLANNDYGSETRARSNELYNADDGWVWQAGNNKAGAALSPINLAVNTAAPVIFDPGSGSSSGTGSGGVIALPAPTVNPIGGGFYLANFPSSVAIIPGNVPASSSIPVYNIRHSDGTTTGWLPYSTPLNIGYTDTVLAKNASTNTQLYTDSAIDSEAFSIIPTPLPIPVITPTGGGYVASAWPSLTIQPNGAPGGTYSAIMYMITHSDGTSTSWSTYSTPVGMTYGDTVAAKNATLNPAFYADSLVDSETYYVTGSTKLPPPILTETTAVNSKGQTVTSVTISFDTSVMPMPAGVRFEYTVDGTDPGVNSNEDPAHGTAYNGTPIVVPLTVAYYEVTARCYPPSSDKTHWDASDPSSDDVTNIGALASGNYDVDTSHLVYPLGKGTTDGHVHQYDRKYNTTNLNMMNLLDSKLRNIQSVIPATTRFKLIVSNGNLSTAPQFVINGNATQATSYENIPLDSLPVYSLGGVSGTTKLTSLAMNCDLSAMQSGGMIPTVTGWVRSNKPGKYGEYRDGALILQAVAVNADGSPAFTTKTSLSNGGVQGVAQTGLLWECTMFWHWTGGPY